MKKVYRILYKITRNRRWLVAYIDAMKKETIMDIRRFRNENN